MSELRDNIERIFELFQKCQKDLSTIMSGLVVEVDKNEREKMIEHWNLDYGSGTPMFPTRPTTAGEVRELIVWIFSDLDEGNKILADNKGWYFLLKSGGRLRLEK